VAGPNWFHASNRLLSHPRGKYSMLFSDFLPANERLDPGRPELLDAILADFRRAFPDLHFELRLDRKVINAQAIVIEAKRCVLIYGGLGLNPKLGEDSLTFVFLHEVGHHLADGPRMPFDLLLACDCVSDCWAAGEGADILQQRSGRQFQIEKAISELNSLLSPPRVPALLHLESRAGTGCWNRQWCERRNALQARRLFHSDGVCTLMEPK
jgi:hypothetical protein